MFFWILAAVLTVILGATTATGSAETPIRVWQPVIVDEALMMELHPVPYFTFGDASWGLSYVARENRVWTERELGRFENLNAANLAGLEVQSVQSGDGDYGLWGDTLKVVLDTSRMNVDRFVNVPHPDSLVAATVECLRATAQPAEGSPGCALRYLEVTVSSPGSLRTFVFELDTSFVPRRWFGMTSSQ